MTMSLKTIQDKFISRLEEKAGGASGTLPRLLRKHFQQVDLDNDGMISVREWSMVVERSGNALAADEATALFEFWDTAGYTREPNGFVAIADATASLMTSELTSNAIFDQKGAAPTRDNQGNRGNRSSVEGGIFGGGVYAADAHRFATNQAGQPAPMLPVEIARPTDMPKGNQSSIEGGIFGQAPLDDTPRAKAHNSNKSSVPGGIFGMDENAPPARAPVGRRYSNKSSIPGGIFG